MTTDLKPWVITLFVGALIGYSIAQNSYRSQITKLLNDLIYPNCQKLKR